MTDHLLQLCAGKDIELFYSNNLSPILSSYVQYGERSIVAHNSFRECPKELAVAVVNYYTQDRDKEISLNIIKEFLKKQFITGTFKIDSLEIILDEEMKKDLDVEFQEQNQLEAPAAEEQKTKSKSQKAAQNKQQPKTQSKKQSQRNKKTEVDTAASKPEPKQREKSDYNKAKGPLDVNDIPEVGIKNITKKSFKGSNTEVNWNEPIKIAEDDVVELDITIDPFNT